MTKYVLKFQLEIPQMPHNLIGPSAQIKPIIWDVFEKNPVHVHCP